MNDGDVWNIVKTTDLTKVTIEDCHLVGDRMPDCLEKNDVTFTTGGVNIASADGFTVEFERPLTTGDSNDKVISAKVTPIIYSYTDNEQVEEHKGTGSAYGVINVDLNSLDGGNIKSSWYGGKFLLHQHYLIIMWTIVVDIFTIIGKYTKFFTRYFEIHSWSLLMLGVASIIIAISGASGEDESDRRILTQSSSNERLLASSLADDDLHGLVGFLTNLSTIALIVTGIIMRFGIALGTKYKFYVVFNITYQRWIHTFLGIFAWIVSRIAVFTGASLHEVLYGSTLFVYSIVETIIAILIYILLETLYRLSRLNNRVALSAKEGKQSSENIKLLERIRSKGLSLL